MELARTKIRYLSVLALFEGGLRFVTPQEAAQSLSGHAIVALIDIQVLLLVSPQVRDLAPVILSSDVIVLFHVELDAIEVGGSVQVLASPGHIQAVKQVADSGLAIGIYKRNLSVDIAALIEILDLDRLLLKDQPAFIVENQNRHLLNIFLRNIELVIPEQIVDRAHVVLGHLSLRRYVFRVLGAANYLYPSKVL